jgi:Ca2+-binding EF-hand superfamily protein
MPRISPISALLVALTLGACAEGGHAVAAVAPAGAEHHSPTLGDLFQRVGYSAGSTLTRSSLNDIVNRAFAAADTNHDGRLDHAECRLANEVLLKGYLASPAIDWDDDGFVSLVEFAAQWHTAFESTDTNHDGVLDARELARPLYTSPDPDRLKAALEDQKDGGDPGP